MEPEAQENQENYDLENETPSEEVAEADKKGHKSIVGLVLIAVVFSLIIVLASLLAMRFLDSDTDDATSQTTDESSASDSAVPDTEPKLSEEELQEKYNSIMAATEENPGLADVGDGRGRNADILGIASTSEGEAYLTHPETGLTLYVLNTAGPCEAECLKKWTPYKADKPRDLDGIITVIELDEEGEDYLQYYWQSRPLFTYNQDPRPGDITGAGDKWSVAKP